MIIGCYDCDVSSTFVWMEGCHIHSMDGGGNFVQLTHFRRAFHRTSVLLCKFAFRTSMKWCLLQLSSLPGESPPWTLLLSWIDPEALPGTVTSAYHAAVAISHCCNKWRQGRHSTVQTLPRHSFQLLNSLAKTSNIKTHVGSDKLVTANPNAVDD